VLLAAAGEPWEAAALRLVEDGAGLVLARRCVDLTDLLGTASAGQARAALVAGDLPGLDADALAHLDRHGVRVVAVADAAAEERLLGLGVAEVVPPGLEGLSEALGRGGRVAVPVPATADPPTALHPSPQPPGTEPPEPDPGGPGRLTAVWGPTGAPGRTTVATTLAADLAARGRSTLLVDADPFGGTVAQHLGVLNQVSGLLAAARLANAGELTPAGLAGACRALDDRLRLLTGLPRPDRWVEVREAAFQQLLDQAVELAPHVVVDVGFSLEEPAPDAFAAGPSRNLMTRAALERADEVVVVGAADPVGLARLARGLVELRDLLPATPLVVAVNRTRPSLGWSRGEVAAMVEQFVRPVGIRFLPEDQEAVDRALMAGRSLVEEGGSPLRLAVAEVADLLLGTDPGDRTRRGRGGRRPHRAGRAGRVRRRTAAAGRRP
jgi:MinD-like ATPase involved in chromosome partitioning or flagellar assembly